MYDAITGSLQHWRLRHAASTTTTTTTTPTTIALYYRGTGTQGCYQDQLIRDQDNKVETMTNTVNGLTTPVLQPVCITWSLSSISINETQFVAAVKTITSRACCTLQIQGRTNYCRLLALAVTCWSCLKPPFETNTRSAAAAAAAATTTVTAALPMVLTQRASCGAVYCNRSCLWMGVWGLLPR